METEHAAALFHLREALEKTEACPNLLIEARSSFKKGLVILENKADKINEGYEIHENMKKIQKAVEVLKKLLNELESSVVTETQRVTVRETKISGRNGEYRKFLKLRTPEKFAVITLRLEQGGFTILLCDLMMQTGGGKPCRP